MIQTDVDSLTERSGRERHSKELHEHHGHPRVAASRLKAATFENWQERYFSKMV